MDHGLMIGMLWGGLLLSAIPIALGIGAGILLLQRYREHLLLQRSDRRRADGPPD